jgi:DNA-binding MarR family transcriptional regulator
MSNSTLPEKLNQPRGRKAWLAVVRAYLLCDAVLVARLAAVNARIGEHEVLINLARTPGMTQQELAQHSFVAKSGISMLLAQMEKQGLVVRKPDANDARTKRVYLTRAGSVLANKSIKIQAELVDGMTHIFTDEELGLVEQVMQRSSKQLETMLFELKD